MSVKSLGDPVFSLQMQALEMKVKLRENIEIHIWGPRHLLLAFKIMAFILCSSLNCQLLLKGELKAHIHISLYESNTLIE